MSVPEDLPDHRCSVYLFVFAHPLRARTFVEKLVKEVRDVAAFRDGAEVRVFDAWGDKLPQIAPLTRDSASALKKEW